MLLRGSCCGPRLPWEPTIVLLVGRSTAEFLSKMGIVEEEADECVYRLELITDCELLPANRLQEILDEANQIVAMTVASIKTARKSL